ncbi:unnamed protein product [Linum trigynum]|uniref:Uncharacterized protein n=1 Tax=Linum trigynum TaxID=586398 RepID=A0AAV2C847_9ROSI
MKLTPIVSLADLIHLDVAPSNKPHLSWSCIQFDVTGLPPAVLYLREHQSPLIEFEPAEIYNFQTFTVAAAYR